MWQERGAFECGFKKKRSKKKCVAPASTAVGAAGTGEGEAAATSTDDTDGAGLRLRSAGGHASRSSDNAPKRIKRAENVSAYSTEVAVSSPLRRSSIEAS